MRFAFLNATYDLREKALIMGILNVTPDSFSDGGTFLNLEKAVAHGLWLLSQGATILDVGGESTRPGASPLEASEELARVIPVIQALHKKTDAPISIDTSKAVVAEAALKAGASIINDISALEDPLMGPLAARSKAGLILMHKQGKPSTMQHSPVYPNDDVVGAVITFLSKARARALEYGVQAEAVILDPGLGFGKTALHNFSLLRAIPRLAELGSPLLIGHSRKSFLKSSSDPVSPPLQERFIPSIALTAVARYHGARLFRVHEPRPHQEAIETIEKMIS